MASCDHLGEKTHRPFGLSYSKTGKQGNRDCFTQDVFPTSSCCNNENNGEQNPVYNEIEMPELLLWITSRDRLQIFAVIAKDAYN